MPEWKFVSASKGKEKIQKGSLNYNRPRSLDTRKQGRNAFATFYACLGSGSLKEIVMCNTSQF